ncbi:MAG: hypothetical protein IPK16_05090 [Anaerolineales bacterium]|nr:hypothetical protein [Anaerolineales bacterium]
MRFQPTAGGHHGTRRASLWRAACPHRRLTAARHLSQPAKNTQQPIQVKQQALPAKRGKMTIRVTTSWAVGDSSGAWRKGVAEQTIEFDE